MKCFISLFILSKYWIHSLQSSIEELSTAATIRRLLVTIKFKIFYEYEYTKLIYTIYIHHLSNDMPIIGSSVADNADHFYFY